MEVLGNKTTILFTKDQIKESIDLLGKQITEDYQNKELVVIGILKGSFLFVSDLIRKIDLPLVVDFIGISSYKGTMVNSCIEVTKQLNIDITNKDVLIIEDIVDTGNTINFIKDYLNPFAPKSIKICSLINKKELNNIIVDYSCFNTNEFVIGYGLDYMEYYRNLPNIYKVERN